jgi:hypothetical protein
VDDRAESEITEAPEAPPARDYAELGERVAAVLRAAEEAAQELHDEAVREAEALRRRAERESRAQAEEERSRASGDAERLRAAALADAEAIRDTAQAAAGRIAQEGQRRLGELRTEARTLERRFESTVDDLHDLIAQLDSVVRGAGQRSHGDVSAAAGPARAEEADTDAELEAAAEHALAEDLRPRRSEPEPVGEADTAPDKPNGSRSPL